MLSQIQVQARVKHGGTGCDGGLHIGTYTGDCGSPHWDMVSLKDVKKAVPMLGRLKLSLKHQLEEIKKKREQVQLVASNSPTNQSNSNPSSMAQQLP